MAILKTLAIFLVVSGLLIWGVRSLPHLSFGAPPPTQPASALAGVQSIPLGDDGPAALEGTVVLDKNATPQVPYILYTRENGDTRTKELIFEGKRGCETQDGDLPCVAGTYDRSQYPDLSAGERIRVNGRINGDQILVESIEVLS